MLKISVIVPNHNGAATLEQCLNAIRASSYGNFECIVVDDNSSDSSPMLAAPLASAVINLDGGPAGPANARNIGARASTGEILFFVDADVLVYPDTLQKIADTFLDSPTQAAVFGSYDDEPGDGQFVSQYKNLFHHFVHQNASESSGSFWSGCGAIRREIFLGVGGFDTERFSVPSIEDIDLGRRLVAHGCQIRVNKAIQVKHLKRWTLASLLKTDVFDRAIPWTQLILDDRNLPNDLNLETSQRWSALIIGFLLFFMGISALFHHRILLLPILFGMFWLTLQSWQWRENLGDFIVGQRSLLGIGILFLIFSGLAFSFGATTYLTPVVILFGIALLGPWLTRKGPIWRKTIFLLTTVVIFFSLFQVMLSYPVWLILLVSGVLGIFLFLNRKFYAFFRRKRGILFAATVMPFHLLYFIYSIFAFGLGLVVYFARMRFPFFTPRVDHRS